MNKIIQHIAFTCLCFNLSAGLCVVKAQSVSVPVEMQMKVLPKILALDRSMNSNPKTSINIGILYNSLIRNSIRVKDEILKFNEVNKISIKNSLLVYIPLDVSSIENLEKELQNYNLYAIYITPLRAYDISKISQVCRDENIISITSVIEFQNYGVSIGFDLIDNRLKILINQTSAKEEGANFSSHLLKIAQIVD